MNDNTTKRQLISTSYANDHMANERTFLAWVRTGLGIMVFGFVVERFALFMRQFALLLGSSHIPYEPRLPSLQGHSSIFGICLVAMGSLLCLLAFFKYKTVEKQIDDNDYRPSSILNLVLTLAILFVGVFLIVYLNTSI